MTKTIELYREHGAWMGHFSDRAQNETINQSAERKAGVVAEIAANMFPGYIIGIRSSEFGPVTAMHSRVVWMNDSWHKRVRGEG